MEANIIFMNIRCLFDVHRGVSLKKDKVYEAQLCQYGWQKEKGWFAMIDETGEEYAYPPHIFEVVENEAKIIVPHSVKLASGK